MWSKISNALSMSMKSAPPTKDDHSQAEPNVMAKVFEQHPNLSMFQPSESGTLQPQHSPPSSPSVHSKRHMFKRMSKSALKEDVESQRAASPSPFKLASAIPKKVKNGHISNGSANGSQLSLGAAEGRSSQELLRRASADMLRSSPDHSRPSQDTTRSMKDSRKRPSLDFLRQEPSLFNLDPSGHYNNQGDSDAPGTPGFDRQYNSVRSILRDPKTPGTGQNVRFFSKDAFKVITPDQSHSLEFQSKPQPPLPDDESPFLGRLNQGGPSTTTTPSQGHNSSGSRSFSRPSVAEIFSAINDPPPASAEYEQSEMSLSFSNPVGQAHSDSFNLFDMSQQLEMPEFAPGLDFDVNAPVFDGPSLDHSGQDFDPESGNQLTSTPVTKDSKAKGKERSTSTPEKQVLGVGQPEFIDEAVFHSKERSPKFPAALHERSQSFSFGQTVFHSMANGTKPTPDDSDAAYPSSDLLKSTSLDISPGPTPPSLRSRTRALSDTVFQSMLRSSPSPRAENPEDDINDVSSPELMVAPEPDPFSAHATTYYTPQTMIPVTPPKGSTKHMRKTSKEESMIISLQTELALRSELCSQYEADLKARDELVEILSKKLSDVEKEDSKRRGALRSWKKKVQELERMCRSLEEAVDNSKQESMERSIMDEASSEALRMLHRQIAGLEREKSDWSRREQQLVEQVDTLEDLVKVRTEDVQSLNEALWNREERDRAINHELQATKEEMDIMNDISVATFNDDALKKLMMERETDETQRLHVVEFELRQEVEELKMQSEGMAVEKGRLEERLEQMEEQLKAKDEEFATLKAELEAQWDHTEKASDKMDALRKEREEVEHERDTLKADLAEMDTRMSSLEVEWNESENKRTEFEAELQEIWNVKEALEKEHEELEDALHQAEEHAQQLSAKIQEREDRISGLEQERQFAEDNARRLEDNLHRRNEEVAQYSGRVHQLELELEQHRDEISSLRREHARFMNDQTRALQESAGERNQTKSQLDELIKSKAEVDVELRSTREQLSSLKDETDKLRRQVHVLRQESADKELKIGQLGKQFDEAREDTYNLNIALDAKQQELEMIKRKIGVRGTAGSTPLSGQASTSKPTHHRRESSIFNATPRPSSAMSNATDVGSVSDAPSLTLRKERKNSWESSTAAKIPALGKSIRTNASATSTPSTVGKGLSRPGSESSIMGPPTPKPRASIGTPTPTSRLPAASISRSSSTKAAPTHRRASSLANDQTPKSRLAKNLTHTSPPPGTVMEQEESEKENLDISSSSTPRRNPIPIPA